MRSSRNVTKNKVKISAFNLIIGISSFWFWPLTLAIADNEQPQVQSVQKIRWVDLLPEGDRAELEALQKHLIDIPPMPDLGSLEPTETAAWLSKPHIGSELAVSAHANAQIELIGYPVPLASPDEATFNGLSFLLVPELGAGLYEPLPPPNQTVRVNLPTHLAQDQSKALPEPDSPIKIIGTLILNNTANKPYAYVIEAQNWDW